MQISVLKDMLISVIQDIQLYNNNRYLVPIFLISLIALWIKEKDKCIRNILVYLSTALVGIFVCPIFAYIGNSFDDEIYYRVWWTIPIGITFCYVCVKLMFYFKTMWKRFLTLAMAIVVIVINGRFVFTNSYHFKSENAYQLPQMAIDVAKEMTIDFDNPVVIMSTELMIYVRQYDSRIQVPFSRYYFGNLNLENDELYAALNGEEYKVEDIVTGANNYGALYVVLNSYKKQDEEIINYDFTFLKCVDGYNIYRNDLVYNDLVKCGVIKK